MFKKISILSALLFCFTLNTAQAETITYTFGGALNELFIINTDAEKWLPPGALFTGSFTYSATEATLTLGIAGLEKDFPLKAAYRVSNNITSAAGTKIDQLRVNGYQPLDFLDSETLKMLEDLGISEMYYTITLIDPTGTIFDASTPSALYNNPMEIVAGLNLAAATGISFAVEAYNNDISFDILLGSASGKIDHITLTSSTPTPEPASVLLTGLGLAGLIALGRRRKALV